VSHNLAAVRMICDRVLVLKSGTVIRDGDPGEAIHAYHQLLNQETNTGQCHSAIRTLKLSLLDESEQPTFCVSTGDEFLIEMELAANRPIRDASIGFFIRDEQDNEVYATRMDLLDADPTTVKPGEALRARFRLTANLLPGNYWIGTSVWGFTDSELSREPTLLDQAANRLQLTVAGRSAGQGTANLFGSCKTDVHRSTAKNAAAFSTVEQ
jgi:lipopolysaccharide transport system ATP-binding protein